MIGMCVIDVFHLVKEFEDIKEIYPTPEQIDVSHYSSFSLLLKQLEFLFLISDQELLLSSQV